GFPNAGGDAMIGRCFVGEGRSKQRPYRAFVAAVLTAGALALFSPLHAQQNPPPTGTKTPQAGQTAPKQETGGGVAGTIQLRREVQGEFLYRFAPKSGTSTSPAPLPAPSGSGNLVPLNLPAGMKPEATTLEVIDLKKGLLARLPVKPNAETP